MVNPGSVLNHFGTGNHLSLDKDQEKVRQAVKDFYKRYYSANLLVASLVGSQSLDEMEALALEHFGDIVNTEAELPDYSNELCFTPEHGLGHMVYMVP